MKKTFLIISLFTVFAACARNDACNTVSCSKDSRGNCINDQDADWQITTRVKTALMKDNSLSSSGRLVSIETTDGVVTLTGNVPSTDESRSIERKVKAIKGVRGVDNQLTIKP